MNAFSKKSIEIGDKLHMNNQYPAICTDGKGTDYVLVQKAQGKTETICLSVFKDGNPAVSDIQVSGNGLSLRPAAIWAEDKAWFAWSEFAEGKWSVCIASYDGTLSPVTVIETGEALFYVSLAIIDNKAAILYNRQCAKKSDVMLATRKDGTYVAQKVNESVKCYRPTACQNRNGDIIVVYDSFDGKSYNVLSRLYSDGRWSDEMRLDESDNRCAQPVVVSPEADLFVVCWYENGIYSFFSYNAVDLRVRNGRLEKSNYQVLVSNRNWYNNIDASANINGYTVFCYTIGKYNIVCNVRKPDGRWSKPVLLSYNDGRCGIRGKVALSDDNELHYVWQWAERNGHEDRYAVAVYNTAAIDELLACDDTEIVTRIDSFVQPIDVVKSLDSVSDEAKNAWLKKNGLDCCLLFGDIHGQSNMSDGMGELDHYYHFAKVDAKMDFCALTDHDCYPDEATQAEWEWNRATRNIFNAEDDFSVLLAYEWTSNEYHHDFGHKNVYYPSEEGGLYTSLSQEGLNPDRLYKSIKKDGGQCIPHHPAADWKLVSAATDWDYYDSEVQRAVEIFSRHADYEKTEALSRYTKNIAKYPRKCVQDALERGYRPGFVAGSDSHQMEHGKEGGILGAFMKENTSQELWNAIWNRKTYATTGARILVSFRMGEAFMGDETKTTEKRVFTCSVLAVNDIRKIEIIKNGKAVYTLNPDTRDVDFTFTDDASDSTDYYYLRVEQVDDHIAWSSPIYVN